MSGKTHDLNHGMKANSKVENVNNAVELVKMKIRAMSTSHDLEKQELYAMRKLRLSIGAGSS